MQMNRIEIAGFLASRPESRHLPSGTKVANARLGESHRYKGADNQPVTQTNWHSLTFYNSLADQALTYDKGTNLFIEGTVQQRKFYAEGRIGTNRPGGGRSVLSRYRQLSAGLCRERKRCRSGFIQWRY